MAQSKTEFELKLQGTPADVAVISRLAWLDAIAASPGAFERLATTYYDGDDMRLAAAGVSLRIRDEAPLRTLCAKASAPGSSPLHRLECERSLSRDEIAFQTGVAEIDRIVGGADDLTAIASTTTDRWRRYVETGGALIEMSAEIGACERLIEPREAGPLAEVELELLKGDPAALFDLAERLVAETEGRLRIGIETKLDRALRGARAPKLRKPEREAPAADARAGDVLAATLRRCAHRIVETATLAADYHDADAVKHLRVALRRLRAAEKTFRAALEEDALEPLSAKAKEFARVVGALRDVDLFLETSLAIADEPRVRARLEAERARRWHAATAALTGAEFGAFSIELFRAAWVETWRGDARKRLDAQAADFAKAMLASQFEKLLVCGSAVDFGDPPTLHPLRIDLKRFRYAAQFFRDFFPAEARAPFFGVMSALQTRLGEVNDAVVAATIADAAGTGLGAAAARAAGCIAGYRGTEAAAAARAAEELWRALAAAPPYWLNAPTTDGP